MGEGRGVYRVLVGRPEGKRPLGRPRRRWEGNIKLDLREIMGGTIAAGLFALFIGYNVKPWNVTSASFCCIAVECRSNVLCMYCNLQVTAAVWGNYIRHGKKLRAEIAQSIQRLLDDRMIGIRLPVGAGNFSLRHHVQTGSGAHPASYPMSTGVLSLG
jgi:hypothetical protein